MKICIAYESKYGNGKKCVEHLKNIINEKGHNTEIFSVRNIRPDSLPEADIYVFSSPTHIGQPARKIKKFLKKFNVQQEGVKYALMATHLNPDASTLNKMDSFLETSKMTKITNGLKVKVEGMKGPLEEGFEKKIESFASDLLKTK